MRRGLPRQNGFSLLELGIVLLVVALLGGGLLPRLSGLQAQSQRQEDRMRLDQARDTLLGFALSQGRLPCAADPGLPAADPRAGEEACPREHGVLPWVTLGLPATDPWGHRYTYYASQRFTGGPLTPGGAAFALDTTGNASVFDLSGKLQASALPAVIVGHGANGLGAVLEDGSRLPGATGSEAENADADLTFILPPPGSTLIDDQLAWVSADLLKARLIAAGRLP